MNKSQLVKTISASTASSRKLVEDVVDELFGTIVTEVRSGRKVTVIGFGAFTPTARGPRVGRNPRTGAVVPIPASNGVRFATGSAFKQALNPKEGVAMAVKKAAAKKAVRKAPAKKTAARKSTAKKAVKKAPATKTAAKKTTAKKAVRKAPARKTAARKTTAKKAVKKAPARKTAPARPPRRRRSARLRPQGWPQDGSPEDHRQAGGKKAPARKTAAKTTAKKAVRKAPARKAPAARRPGEEGHPPVVTLRHRPVPRRVHVRQQGPSGPCCRRSRRPAPLRGSGSRSEVGRCRRNASPAASPARRTVWPPAGGAP